MSFFFNPTATTEIYTLSLHDALPIWITLDDYMRAMWRVHGKPAAAAGYVAKPYTLADARARLAEVIDDRAFADHFGRSEEHTSELQSRLHLVCRLLLEKKKKKSL